jgi:hypothetical protein
MELILAALAYAYLTGILFLSGVRSDETTFFLLVKTTRSEGNLRYVSALLLWLLFFGIGLFSVVSLSMKAFSSEPPFATRSFLPSNFSQWALAALAVLFGYMAWRLSRVLGGLAAEKGSGA